MQRILANTFLTLLSLLAAFVIAELAVRHYYDEDLEFKGYRELNDYSYQPRPYVMGVANPTYQGINSLGYRDNLPPMPKPKGEFRILVFGGSTVFGVEGNFLVKMIEGELKKFREDIKVYNFGISSSVYQEDYIRLVVDGSPFEPDMVISYGGGNDFYNPNPPGVPHRFNLMASNPLWHTQVEDYPAWRLFFFGSKLLRILFKAEFTQYFNHISPTYHYKSYDPYYENREYHVRKTLTHMDKFARSRGALFLSVLQPLRGFQFFGPKREKFKDEKYHLEKFYRAIKNSPATFPTLDLSLEKIEASEWLDYIHVSVSANERIAKKISEKVLSLIDTKN